MEEKHNRNKKQVLVVAEHHRRDKSSLTSMARPPRKNGTELSASEASVDGRSAALGIAGEMRSERTPVDSTTMTGKRWRGTDKNGNS